MTKKYCDLCKVELGPKEAENYLELECKGLVVEKKDVCDLCNGYVRKAIQNAMAVCRIKFKSPLDT